MIFEQDDLELDDDDIPEYWPHLRANRAERYRKARKLLEDHKKQEAEFRRTLVEIIELPETLTEYGD